ncbi:MAG: hypothetical protein ACI86M_000619 [Saprospiraceae bacterium]|jgi:hypothetical protein
MSWCEGGLCNKHPFATPNVWGILKSVYNTQLDSQESLLKNKGE